MVTEENRLWVGDRTEDAPQSCTPGTCVIFSHHRHPNKVNNEKTCITSQGLPLHTHIGIDF